MERRDNDKKIHQRLDLLETTMEDFRRQLDENSKVTMASYQCAQDTSKSVSELVTAFNNAKVIKKRVIGGANFVRSAINYLTPFAVFLGGVAAWWNGWWPQVQTKVVSAFERLFS
jgi:hypothetical protein